MNNLVNQIDSKIVKEYGITEAFFFNGEFYTTSNYELSQDLIAYLESLLK